MTKPLRIEMEALLASGRQVHGYGEDLTQEHQLAQTQIEAALLQWVGASQAAMAETARTWQASSATLAQRLFDHADSLHACHAAYTGTESSNAASLGALQPGPPEAGRFSK